MLGSKAMHLSFLGIPIVTLLFQPLKTLNLTFLQIIFLIKQGISFWFIQLLIALPQLGLIGSVKMKRKPTAEQNLVET